MNRNDFEAMFDGDMPPDPDDMYLRRRNGKAVLSSCVGLLVIAGLFVLVVGLALGLTGCSSDEESTDDAITRIAYEQSMEFVSDTVSETSCEVWAESPDTFVNGFVQTFGKSLVTATGQTYDQVVSEAEMARDLTAEMEEACG